MIAEDKASWIDRKQELKKEIIKYFHQRGATKEQIIEAAKFIKWHGELHADMCFEGNFDDDDEYLYEFINPKFRPKVRQKVHEFCIKVSQLHFEALQHLDSQRPWKECWARDDFEYEDWLESQPLAEIVITHENIVLTCSEFIEGLQQRLPKGGDYLGNSTWHFPLSARFELEKLGYPVLKYPGIGEVVVEKFNPQKFTTEKVSFEIWSPVFNISEGWGDEDDLGASLLWRGNLSLEQFKRRLWGEIKTYLPQYKEGIFTPLGGESSSYKGLYFRQVMRLVELVKLGQKVKLIYISDQEHALLIKRCIYWLAGDL